jgi:hypothetical protein
MRILTSSIGHKAVLYYPISPSSLFFASARGYFLIICIEADLRFPLGLRFTPTGSSHPLGDKTNRSSERDFLATMKVFMSWNGTAE